MEHDDLRGRARTLLEQGRLPRAHPTRSFAGRGTGAACDLCDDRIPASQTEVEIDTTDRTLVLHRPCAVVWSEERSWYDWRWE